MDPLLVHRSQESFPVLPETVPFATRNFLRVCIHRASLSAASISSRCIFRTLSMLNSGVLSEPRRCRPDVGTAPEVGFFLGFHGARHRGKPPTGGGEHGKLPSMFGP